MPNTSSTRKNVRVIARKTTVNRLWLKKLKVAVSGARKAKEVTKEMASSLQRIIDKAAKNKIIDKNKAARLKSRLLKAKSAHGKKR